MYGRLTGLVQDRAEMADSNAAPAKLSLSSSGGSRDGRLVISGVRSGDGNGPRVFLLSAVKADRPSDGSSSSTTAGRVSLLRTAASTPGSQSKAFTTDTFVQGKRPHNHSLSCSLRRQTSPSMPGELYETYRYGLLPTLYENMTIATKPDRKYITYRIAVRGD